MRSFRTAFDRKFLKRFQKGVLDYTYKGVPCLKCPLDLAIYSKLLWDEKPGSLIEIGTNRGGSALWFADTIQTLGLSCPIVTVDIAPNVGFSDPRIEFLTGSALELQTILTDARLAQLPHPWLVVEDSAHTYEITAAVMSFFASRMITGDILVIEDGVVDDLGISAEYNGGPNRAVAEFFRQTPDAFELLLGYCDMFGVNATYNPNGYLKKR